VADTVIRELPEGLDRLPPTQDELPYSDGMPMESQQHVLQMILLIATLQRYFAGVRDVFVGGNMFVYFSPDQVNTHDFRGPDVFVALDVPTHMRKSWVVWDEKRGPDVVIELLSDSTAAIDKGEKLLVYQDQLRVPEYFWFHPLTAEFDGVVLVDGVYRPLSSTTPGMLPCERLGLSLVVWEGEYSGGRNRWLRWATPDGEVLPTSEEAAAEQVLLAEQERARATERAVLTGRERARVAELEAMLTRYRDRFGDLPD
jgi:Uma2 family endonuclease